MARQQSLGALLGLAGTISAATHPEFVSGAGSILSAARGTLFSLQ